MKESKYHTFINHQQGFTLHVIEGNKILNDLKSIHNIETSTYSFFKDIILSSLHFLHFLKGGENLGFYIDSEDPYFRFKIEIGSSGKFRTLFLPEEIPVIPAYLNGICRITKLFQSKDPYTSVIDMDQISPTKLVNSMLDKSYQAKCAVLLDPQSPNSIMISKLPPSNVDKKVEDFEDLSIADYQLKFAKEIKSFFNFDVMEEDEINEILNELGYKFLASKDLQLYCPCSKERFLATIQNMSTEQIDDLYNEQGIIETRCDYCNKVYHITKGCQQT